MPTSTFLKLYAIALPTFLAIDLIWLGLVARSFYQDKLGHLLRADVNWAAAIVFYLLFVLGMVGLVVWPAVERQSVIRALLLGALIGIVAYSAYDLTNLATMKGFPVLVAVVDIAWGAVLCSSVCAITYSVWMWVS